jgi:hypothetical protein
MSSNIWKAMAVRIPRTPACYTSSVPRPPKRTALGTLPPPTPDGAAADVDLDAEIAKLDPAQKEMFVKALALSLRKRRMLLVGYLVAIVVMFFGQIPALMYWAARAPGEFRGWAFLVPPALAGVVLVHTGRRVRRLKPTGS